MVYFRYDNASRALKLGDKRFVFDVVAQLAGSWTGVLAVEDEHSINLLRTEGARFGVAEISAEEYAEQLKKKVSSPSSSKGSDSNKILLPRPGRQSAAVVVNRGVEPPSKTKDISETLPKVLVSVEDVLTLGKADFVDPIEAKPEVTKGRKGKKK